MNSIDRSRQQLHESLDLRELAETEAREWFLLQQERQLAASEQADFEAWINEDALHEACYQQLQLIWAGLPEAAALEKPSGSTSWRETASGWFTQVMGNALNMQWAIASVATLVVVISVVWMGTDLSRNVSSAQLYSTEISEVRDIPLRDGSLVTLGADSAISVDFKEDSRYVRLEKGQAFFNVAKNREKPFYVATDHATVKVVGTRFEVYQNLDQVKVSVEEGVVEVMRNLTQPYESQNDPKLLNTDKTVDKRILTAGQQVKTSGQKLGEVIDLNDLDVASWREGRFVYRDAKLSDVIADVNRYRQGKILLGTEPLKKYSSYDIIFGGAGRHGRVHVGKVFTLVGPSGKQR